jgi:hypothetical protein
MTEPSPPPLPVKPFVDLNADFLKIFSIRRLTGFMTSFHYPLPPGASVSGAIGLHPTQISYRSTPQGLIPVQYSPTTFELVLESVASGLTFHLTAFPIQAAQALFTPHPYGALYASLVRSMDGKLIPTIGIRFSLPHLNLRIQTQSVPQKKAAIDVQATVGTNDRGACFQFVRRPAGKPGWAAMLYRTLPGRATSLSVMQDDDRTFVLRTEREIRNWKIGVNFHCTARLRTGLDLAWMAKIGRFTAHSVLKSSGEVRSSFRAKMTEQAAVLVTGELDHVAHAYRFGVALEWDQRQPLAPKPRGWFGRLTRWLKPVREIVAFS